VITLSRVPAGGPAAAPAADAGLAGHAGLRERLDSQITLIHLGQG
jgi:hypothetical protein